MRVREFAESLEQAFIKMPDEGGIVERNAALIQRERQLHHGESGKRNRKNPRGLDSWSKTHASQVDGIGRLPYWPDKIKSQRLDRPAGQINRVALWLPETTYLKTFRKLYGVAVGSQSLAGEIIDGFDETPAFVDSSQSVTDYAIDCLESDISFGISSGHLDRLSDIADFEAGLSLAVAARKGRKYIENFKLLINKNITRESYKKIPLPLLISTGLVAYWGLPPGESMEEHGISEEIAREVNQLMIDQYRQDRKLGAVVLGFVPSGSRAEKQIDPVTQKLVALRLKEAYTGSFMIRCAGGIIPANRIGNEFRIGQVIELQSDGKKKNKPQLVDDVNMAHAAQGARLSGVPVSFPTSGGEKRITVFPGALAA